MQQCQIHDGYKTLQTETLFLQQKEKILQQKITVIKAKRDALQKENQALLAEVNYSTKKKRKAARKKRKEAKRKEAKQKEILHLIEIGSLATKNIQYTLDRTFLVREIQRFITANEEKRVNANQKSKSTTTALASQKKVTYSYCHPIKSATNDDSQKNKVDPYSKSTTQETSAVERFVSVIRSGDLSKIRKNNLIDITDTDQCYRILDALTPQWHEGFVNALFTLMKLDLRCPSFSTLSKRLRTLKLTRPFYRLVHANAQAMKAITIDSTGLKCYGQDEWALEKHGETRQKREWRKLHITVDHHHIIQTSELTDRKIHDMEVVDNLIAPIINNVNQVTADTAYDANKIYFSLQNKFPNVDIAIPPKSGSTYNKESNRLRNRTIEEIKCYGRTAWQTKHRYGNRNNSEYAIGRYKRILGNKLHAREFV